VHLRFHFTFRGKNHLLPAVRKWNASGRQPRIRVAPLKEFFTYILSKYRSEIPPYQGDWGGLWTEVRTNSPGISFIPRQLQKALRTNGLLWSAVQIRSGLPVPSANLLGD
jgi:hypothetical protein